MKNQNESISSIISGALIIASIFMSSSSTQAGNLGDGKGNGGDAVVCYHDDSVGKNIINQIKIDYENGTAPFEFEKYPERLSAMTSIITYDQWFSKSLGMNVLDRKPINFTNDKNEIEWLSLILKNLASKSTYGETLTQVSLEEIPFTSNWAFVSGVSEINDTDASDMLPGNCIMVQLAKQNAGIVYVDKNLYSILSLEDKVTLLLHELVYFNDVISHGSTTSARTRQMVAYLTSQNSLSDDTFAVNERIGAIFGRGESDCILSVGKMLMPVSCDLVKRGVDEKIEAVMLSKGIFLRYGDVNRDSKIEIKHGIGGSMRPGVKFYANGNIHNIIAQGTCSTKLEYEIEFDENGNLTKVDFLAQSDLQDRITLRGKGISGYLTSNSDLDCWRYNFELHPGLKLKAFTPKGANASISVKEGQPAIPFMVGSRVEFYENGTVKSGYVGENKSSKNKIKIQGKKFKYGQYVEFDENGNLKN